MGGRCGMSITAMFALMSIAADAEADVRFGIASEPYPPFAWKDASGEWVGWEVDLMNAVCRQLKEKCSIVDVAWEGMIPLLNGHFIDVIWATMSITDERLKSIDFTDVYMNTPNVLIGLRDGVKETSRAHLKGKIIGVQSGTVHVRFAEQYYGATSTIKIYQTQDEVNQDLTAGRVDYVVLDALVADTFLKTDVGTSCCELKGTVPIDGKVSSPGVGGGVRKDDPELKTRLNAAIRVVLTSGECDAITKKYVTINICGE
jgi:polar amino acid transport system substrate-binding protein